MSEYSRVVISVDAASYDSPERFRVNLCPRVLRALSILADAQAFYGDGHFEVAPAVRAEAPDDDAFVEHVILIGADEEQMDAVREYVDTDAWAALSG